MSAQPTTQQDDFDPRRYAVFVDESQHRNFFWVLIERNAEQHGEWTALEASTNSATTWLGAFDAGNAALVKLVSTHQRDFERLHPGSHQQSNSGTGQSPQ